MTDSNSEKENGLTAPGGLDGSTGSVKVSFTEVKDFGISQSHGAGKNGGSQNLALQLEGIRNLMKSREQGDGVAPPPAPHKAFDSGSSSLSVSCTIRKVQAQPSPVKEPPGEPERTIVRTVTVGSVGSGGDSLDNSQRKLDVSSKDLKAMMAALSTARAQKATASAAESSAAAVNVTAGAAGHMPVRRVQIAAPAPRADSIGSVASLGESSLDPEEPSHEKRQHAQQEFALPMTPERPKEPSQHAYDLTTPPLSQRDRQRASGHSGVFVNPLYISNVPDSSPQASPAVTPSQHSNTSHIYQPRLYRTSSGNAAPALPQNSLGSSQPSASFGVIPKLPPRRKISDDLAVAVPEPPPQGASLRREPSADRALQPAPSMSVPGAAAETEAEGGGIRPRRSVRPHKLEPIAQEVLERRKSQAPESGLEGGQSLSDLHTLEDKGITPKGLGANGRNDSLGEDYEEDDYFDEDDPYYTAHGRHFDDELGASGHLAGMLQRVRPSSSRLARETARLRAKGIFAQGAELDVEIDHETMTVRPKSKAPPPKPPQPDMHPKGDASAAARRMGDAAPTSLVEREAAEAQAEKELEAHREAEMLRRGSNACSESEAAHPFVDGRSAPGDLLGRDFDGFSISPPSTAGRSEGYPHKPAAASNQKLNIKSRGPRWTLVKAELDDPRPVPVAGHVVACVENRWVFTCLGVSGDTGKNLSGDRVCAYDTAARQWIPVTVEGDLPPPIAYASAVEVQPYELAEPLVLIYGGWLGGSECSQELYVLEGFGDISAESPQMDLAFTKPVTVGPAPPPRSHHTATIVRGGLGIDVGECSDPHVIRDPETQELVTLPRQHMVVFGGWSPQQKLAFRPMGPNAHLRTSAAVKASSSGCFMNDIHALDVDTLEWIRIVPHGGNTPPPRGSHVAFVHNRGLYVWGGQGDQGPMADMWCLDLKRLQWSRIVQKGYVPSPRSGHAVSVIGNRVVLFGGTDGSKAMDDLYVLNMTTFTWTRVDTIARGPTPRPVMGHAMCVLGSERIFCLGGLGRDPGAKEPTYRRDAWMLDVSQPQIDNVHLRPSGNTGSPYEALVQRLYDPVYDPLSEKKGPVKIEYSWFRRKGTKGLWHQISNAREDRYTPNVDDVGYMIGVSVREVQEDDGMATGVSHFEYGVLLVTLDPLVDKVAREYLVNKRCEFVVNVAVKNNTAVERGLLVLTDEYVRLKGNTSVDFKTPWPRQFKAVLMASSPFAFGFKLHGNIGDVYFAVAQTTERDLVVSTARAFWSLAFRLSKPPIADTPFAEKPLADKIAEAGPTFAANVKMEIDAQITKVQEWISTSMGPPPASRPKRRVPSAAPSKDEPEEEEANEEPPNPVEPTMKVVGQYRHELSRPAAAPQTSFLQQLMDSERPNGAARPSSKAAIVPEAAAEPAMPRAVSAKKLPAFGASPARPGSGRAAVHPSTGEASSPAPPSAPPPERGFSVERRQAALASPLSNGQTAAAAAPPVISHSRRALFAAPSNFGSGPETEAIHEEGEAGTAPSTGLFSLGVPKAAPRAAVPDESNGRPRTGASGAGVSRPGTAVSYERRGAEEDMEEEPPASSSLLNSSMNPPRLRYLAFQKGSGAETAARQYPPAIGRGGVVDEEEEVEATFLRNFA